MELIQRELVPDLAQLDELTETSILKVLQARYDRDIIYTRVQDILISLNPRKALAIYGDEAHTKYAWDNLDIKDPHVFEVAATAYRRLRESDTNQVVIVSGESGAGKTEATKHMVRHIVHMCQEGDMALHDKIVEINPLLESFGNAKTIMNGNSSRFAKYLEIGFTEEGHIAGATVRDYMLEKSRVVHQSRGEGTFHIFYALFAGCPRQKREDLFLNQVAGEFRMMKSDIESLDMDERYREMYDYNMKVLEKINVDKDVLLAMLAGVINITEIEFQDNKKGYAEIKDAAPYAHAAILLDLDEVEFGQGLISCTKIFNGEEVVTFKSVKEAEDSRDALAKVLYERMFGWLVRQINQELHPNKRGANLVSIGILDIAGFEKLHQNSFEQLLINLVNEKLQNFMNDLIFNIEMSIYREEGIQLEGINFENNDDTLQLLEVRTHGILETLDEMSNLKIGSDQGFVMEIKKKFARHRRFETPKGSLLNFSIAHFAALVTYDANGFIEKNRDRLNDELMVCMKNSKDDFISDLFKVKRGPTGTISETKFNYRKSRRAHGRITQPRLMPETQIANDLAKSLKTRFGEKLKAPNNNMTSVKPKGKQQTLTSYFTSSLLDLLDKLRSAKPFYVRCLKANMRQARDTFDTTVVADQLRYNGLAEVAKIRKMGYAVRKSHKDFTKRYKWMSGKRGGDDKSRISGILFSCHPEYHRDFRIGKSKVFMTEDLDLHLEHLLQVREKAASRAIARWFRRALAEKRRREEEERRRKEEEERKRREEERRRKEEEERKQIEEKERLERMQQLRQSASGNVNIFGTSTKLGPTLGQSLGQSKKTGFDIPAAPIPPPLPGTSGETSGGSLSSSDKSSLGDTFQGSRGEQRPPSPVQHIDPLRQSDKKKDDKQSPDNTDGKDNTGFQFWDVCQMVARERKIKDVYERRSLQVIKVITYAVMFAILLWCAVSQKISLMILASAQYDRTANRTESDSYEDSVIAAGRHFLMSLAIVIPYILIFLTSLFKWLFGNLPFPQVKTLVLCFIVESLHTLGLCTLCFLVLPELDVARGIMLMSCVGIAPALLAPVCTSNTRNTAKGSFWQQAGVISLDVLAILIFGAFIPVVLLTDPDHFLEESSLDNSTYELVFFICSLIFISFQWWENFVDDRFCGPTRQHSGWKMFVLSVKFDLQESRPIVSTFMSFWKVGLTSLLAWIYRSYLPINTHFEQRNIDEIGLGEVFDKLGDMPIKMNAAILTLTLATFVGNYAGTIACKLQMQEFSFSLPLFLSVPISVLVVVLECSETFSMLGVFTDERVACMEAGTYTENYYWLHYLYGAAVWLALYWVCRHILYPTTERLAKIERVFVNPYYCGILFEQNFILGRRRHNRKVHKDFKDEQFTFRLSDYDSRMDENGEEHDNVDNNTEDVNDDKFRSPSLRTVPMIYACATMWHENKQEMVQIMKSLFRMDRDQCLRKNAEVLAGKEDDDFYDFEAHIMFDDAMEINDDEEFEPNQFVKLMMSVIDEAASAVYEKQMRMKPPFKVPTPYGGQLIFSMPGDNFMFVHMKDKNKIRHRKRWSQVMYMYYLLGYRIVRLCQETVTSAIENGQLSELLGWQDRQGMSVGNIGRSHIFHAFDDQVIKKANNTYLLALDGDVDFSPGAVRLLLDRMRKSDKVGAACGRIHPIGTGPVVWFQKFEYAIAHWLQKATEHVLGCVLCSPGCFSLFRGSALMDDNVMKKYTILPTEASHHLMYDQGEDRWLCTLLLQQGYRVDYVAASDAFTYAPEGFAEFFNQRRRWMPSTVANIIDLLADYKNTVFINSNISMLYIFYQAALLVSTIVGPATVLMMIAGANLVVFKVNLINSYMIALVPAVFYFALCFLVKPKWQILAAEILTGFYAFIMMIVFVGTAVTAAKESPFHPSVIFIGFLVLLFAGAALLHPEEWTCVIFGVLYFLLIPTGFLLLIFYSLTNMHIVSWGTREVPKKKTAEELEEEKKKAEAKKKKKEQGWFGRILPQAPLKDLKELVGKLTDIQGKKKDEDATETNKLLEKISSGIERLVAQKQGGGARPKEVRIDMDPVKSDGATGGPPPPAPVEGQQKGILKRSRPASVTISDSVTNMQDKTEEVIYDKVKSVKKTRDDLVNPAWADCKELGKGQVVNMVPEELKFWQGFLGKYLYPLTLTCEQKKATSKSLIELRNNVCLGMVMINLLWIAINFMFQLTSPTKIKLTISGGDNNLEEDLEENDEEPTETADNVVSVDALGMLFIFFFLIILFLQCIGMIIHRWGTFLHLVSVTQLRNPFKKYFGKAMQNNMEAQPVLDTKDAIKIMDQLLKDPTPDYSDDDEDSTADDQEEAKQELKNLQSKGTRFLGNTLGPGGLGNTLGTSRKLGTTTGVDDNKMEKLSKSLKIMAGGLRATGSRFAHAPVNEEFQRKVQDQYRKKKDNKYKDRELPPIRQRSRLNLGPGRSALEEKFGLRHRGTERERDGPLVPEREADEEIYDVIRGKGTVSRKIGKKLNVMFQTDITDMTSGRDDGDYTYYRGGRRDYRPQSRGQNGPYSGDRRDDRRDRYGRNGGHGNRGYSRDSPDHRRSHNSFEMV